MSKAIVEFSRPLDARRIAKTGSVECIAATPEECLALARRIDLPAIHALSAELTARPWQGGGLKLEGTLEADIDQISVVSGITFRARVVAPVTRFFLPPGASFDPDEADVDILSEGEADMGEVVTESLLLALDPYPRLEVETFGEVHFSPDEAEPADESPFARLRDRSAPKS